MVNQKNEINKTYDLNLTEIKICKIYINFVTIKFDYKHLH